MGLSSKIGSNEVDPNYDVQIAIVGRLDYIVGLSRNVCPE